MTRWTRAGLFELFRLNAAGKPVGEIARITGYSRAVVRAKLSSHRAKAAERTPDSSRGGPKISPRKRYLAAVRERLREMEG